jgi:hypothetical protein
MDLLAKFFEALRSLGLLHRDIEKISSQIEAYTAQHHSEQSREQPDPKPPLLVRLEPQTKSDEENARESARESRDTQRLGVESGGLRIAILALIVSSVVASANILQWAETRRAVALAAISADASQQSAKASQEGIEINKKLMESSIDNFRMEQRAWITVAIGLPTIDIAKSTPETHVQVTNAGKTFAVHLTIANHFGIFPTLIKQLPNTPHPKENSLAVIAPGTQS